MTSYKQPANLAEQVYEAIKEKILTGEYEDAQPLTELALSKELNVSRTPIREALKQLEAEELVELRPNRGAVVNGIRQSDIEDIYEIRSLMEGRAAAKAAVRCLPEDIDQLTEITDLTEFYTERSDYDRLVVMDDRFHRLIYQMTGSRIFERILTELHSYAKSMRTQSMKEPGRAQAMLKEHRAIVEAISRHDAQKASRLMEQHIANVTINMEKNHLIDNTAADQIIQDSM